MPIFSALYDRHGTIAVLFGLLLVPLMGMLGMAIDGLRLYQTQADLRFALESAMIAGLRGNSVAERNELAHGFFQANWQAANHDLPKDGSLSVSVDHPAASHFLVGKASYRMPAIFMVFAGMPYITVKAEVNIDLNKVALRRRF